MQQELPFQKKVDKVILLAEARRRMSRVIDDPPTKPTLIGYIQMGWLVGYQHPINGYWYVWTSSVEDYIARTVQTKEQIAA